MFYWSHEASISTPASGAQIWAVWTNTDGWHEWNEGTEKVTLDAPFAAGVKGSFKPKGASAVAFQILESTPEQGFRDRSTLPLTHLDFVHLYTPNATPGTGGHLTHRVEMRGWLTPLFRRVIGREIVKTMPDSLGRLSRLAHKLA